MKLKLIISKALFITIIFSSFNLFSQHTFSIVAVDTTTGEIGSAGATCISAEDGALAISDIILGVGAIHTQAYWHPTNQANARARMQAGDSPQQVIDWLIANDVSGSPSYRQYGIVDLNDGTPRSAAHTGSDTDNFKLHATGDNYSIQGNILISADVVHDMESAFLNNTGTLADKLMAALQGAKRPGADSRCFDYGISSASSFLRVAKSTDTDSSYGNLSLDLNVWITSDVFEPIDALQELYNTYLGVEKQSFKTNLINIYPNPVKDLFYIQSKNVNMNGFEIIDTNGKVLQKRETSKLHSNIIVNTSDYNNGIYIINIYHNQKKIATKKLVIK